VTRAKPKYTIQVSAEPLAIRVPEAARLTSQCESAIWRLIRNGELKVKKNGKSTLIPLHEIRQWLDAPEGTAERQEISA
jgi:predicted DNA-binding transcriptional regulator AlpA